MPPISRLFQHAVAPVLAIVVIGTPAAIPAAPASAVAIEPHRAVYKMTLASSRSAGSIVDVTGRMQFEWSDTCDGWTIEQRFGLDFLYAEGEQTSMRLSYATWEAKDGLSYRFNVRKTMNGELDEEVRGEAMLTRDGGPGTVQYIKPKALEMPLPEGTLFPTRHTIDLLKHAASGDAVFLRTVFDGSDAEGPSEINAVIGKRNDRYTGPVASPLLTGPAWPVRLAFFPLTGDESVPEYELNMDLMKSGIARSMRIEYEDFSLDVQLEAIEPLPKSRC